MNDNPKKEDIERAIKDARVRRGRAKMKGDSDDEEFNARKEKILKSLKEALHPRVKSALDHAPPELVLHSAKGAHRRLKGKKIKSGIESTKTAKGSSRAVMRTAEHDVVLDDKPAKLSTVLKTAYKSLRSKYQGRLLGQYQNDVESSDAIQKHSVMIRQKDGTWKSNPDGLIPPVLYKDRRGKYLHIGRAYNATDDQIRALTKSNVHHKGLSSDQLFNKIEYPNKRDLESPHIQRFRRFMHDTGVKDFHGDNWGIWTHPHTGEKHLVLRDAGFDDFVLNAYRDSGHDYINTRSNFVNHIKIKTPTKKKLEKLRSRGLSPEQIRQKTQEMKKAGFIKTLNIRKSKTTGSTTSRVRKINFGEEWKRAALMGAAATAAGAGTAAAIGFPVVAGAVIAGGHYALSKKGLRKDWKRKTFREEIERIRSLVEGKKYDQKRIEKEKEKKHKAGNAKAAAMRKLYAKLGYKGNPGEFDLDEGVIGDVGRAAKEGLKDKVAWGMIAAPIPGSAPLGIAKMAATAVKAYRNKKALA